MSQNDTSDRLSSGGIDSLQTKPSKILKLLSNNDDSVSSNCFEDSKEGLTTSPSWDDAITCKASIPRAPLLTPDECGDDMSPDQYLKLIVLDKAGVTPFNKPALSLPSDFFPLPTPQQLTSFSTELMEIIRDNNVEELRSMYEKGDESFTLQCCNRFGESVIHTACRRGFTEMVKFLLNEAQVSIRCRDDCGRTPFHDALWNPRPQFDLLHMLLEQEPLLLFLSDKRGNTPFEYARRDHWDKWRRFLYERRNMICPDASRVRKYLA